MNLFILTHAPSQTLSQVLIINLGQKEIDHSPSAAFFWKSFFLQQKVGRIMKLKNKQN